MAEYVVVDPADNKARADNGGHLFMADAFLGRCPDVANCCYKCYEYWWVFWDCDAHGWSDILYAGAVCITDGQITGQWIDTLKGENVILCGRIWLVECNEGYCQDQFDCESCENEHEGPTIGPSAPDNADETCCGDPCPCPHDPELASRSDPPETIKLAFANIHANPICSRNTVAPYENWRMDFSGLTGRSFTFTYPFTAGIAVDVKVLECRGTGVGDPDANNCDCIPDEDVTVSATLYYGYIDVVWTFAAGVDGQATARIFFDTTDDCRDGVFPLPETSTNWYDMLHGAVIKTVCVAGGGGGGGGEAFGMDDGLIE